MEFGKAIANYFAGRIKGRKMVKKAIYNVALEVSEACNNNDELEKFPPFTEDDCDDGDGKHCTFELDGIQYAIRFDDIVDQFINNIDKIKQEEVDMIIKKIILRKLGLDKLQKAL